MTLHVDIKKELGDFTLQVCFSADSGVLGILGASGCGKSMTLKCIAGIETPDEGRISLDGETLFDSRSGINLPPQKRRAGYLFQNFALFPNMTVLENIMAGSLRAGDSGRQTKAGRQAQARDMIALLRLTGLENRLPSQLSGGQQQRTALARILVSKPRLLLLDEPFSSLDSYLKWQLEMALSDILDSFPGPSVFVSHNRREIRRLCRKACILDRGRSQEVRPVAGLFENPGTLSACLLSGCKNISPVLRPAAPPPDDRRLTAPAWGCELETAEPIPPDCGFAGVHAHSLTLVSGPGPNTIFCRLVKRIEDTASLVLILAPPAGSAPDSLLRLELKKEHPAADALPDALYVHIPPEAIMLLR